MPDFEFRTTPRFWKLFGELPTEIQDLAVEKYELFKRDPFHPSRRVPGQRPRMDG